MFCLSYQLGYWFVSDEDMILHSRICPIGNRLSPSVRRPAISKMEKKNFWFNNFQLTWIGFKWIMYEEMFGTQAKKYHKIFSAILKKWLPQLYSLFLHIWKNVFTVFFLVNIFLYFSYQNLHLCVRENRHKQLFALFYFS